MNSIPLTKGKDSFGKTITPGEIIRTGQSPANLCEYILQAVSPEAETNLSYVRLWVSEVRKAYTPALLELHNQKWTALSRSTWDKQKHIYPYIYDKKYPASINIRYSIQANCDSRYTFVFAAPEQTKPWMNLSAEFSSSDITTVEAKQQIRQILVEFNDNVVALFKSGESLAKIISPYNKRLNELTKDLGYNFLLGKYEEFKN